MVLVTYPISRETAHAQMWRNLTRRQDETIQQNLEVADKEKQILDTLMKKQLRQSQVWSRRRTKVSPLKQKQAQRMVASLLLGVSRGVAVVCYNQIERRWSCKWRCVCVYRHKHWPKHDRLNVSINNAMVIFPNKPWRFELHRVK